MCARTTHLYVCVSVEDGAETMSVRFMAIRTIITNLILLYFQIFKEKKTNFNILQLLMINQPSTIGCPYVKN